MVKYRRTVVSLTFSKWRSGIKTVVVGFKDCFRRRKNISNSLLPLLVIVDVSIAKRWFDEEGGGDEVTRRQKQVEEQKNQKTQNSSAKVSASHDKSVRFWKEIL